MLKQIVDKGTKSIHLAFIDFVKRLTRATKLDIEDNEEGRVSCSCKKLIRILYNGTQAGTKTNRLSEPIE